jgi:catalase
MAEYTGSGFLNDMEIETPVFVRFSNWPGHGVQPSWRVMYVASHCAFIRRKGIFDLVGNNMPIFFIQDAIKFTELVHAVKQEPDHEISQVASAHDTFWDFISLTPESAHMFLWLMSARALPRSYRMIEGFGVHTFRFVNADRVACFVKSHWKSLLGVHSVACVPLMWNSAIC